MPPLYSTKVVAKGGRHGSVRSEDGLLDLSLALPKALRCEWGQRIPKSYLLRDM
jgi:lipoyl-dependent peroxiredoxin